MTKNPVIRWSPAEREAVGAQIRQLSAVVKVRLRGHHPEVQAAQIAAGISLERRRKILGQPEIDKWLGRDKAVVRDQGLALPVVAVVKTVGRYSTLYVHGVLVQRLFENPNDGRDARRLKDMRSACDRINRAYSDLHPSIKESS